MKYIVTICHPNELVQRNWTQVDVVRSKEEIDDILASPSFDVFDGLIVQVNEYENLDETIYIGVFYDNAWVNLGYNSKAMNSMDWDGAEDTSFLSNKSVIQVILECGDHLILNYALKDWLTKSAYIRMIVACMRAMIPYGLRDDFILYLDRAEQGNISVTDKDRMDRQVSIIYNDLPRIEYDEAIVMAPNFAREHDMANAIFSMCRMCLHKDKEKFARDGSHCLAYTIAAIVGYTRDVALQDRAKLDMCNLMRSNFSMMDFLLALVKNQCRT